VFCVFLSSTPTSHSPLVLFRTFCTASPARWECLWSQPSSILSVPWVFVGLMILTLAVLGVTITCSICYDRADDSSIHGGMFHILESTYSTTRCASLPMALVSRPPFCQGQGNSQSSSASVPSSRLDGSWVISKKSQIGKCENRKIVK